METRDKVRQRRMERIRQLQESESNTPYNPPEYPNTFQRVPLPNVNVRRDSGVEDFNGSSMHDLSRWNDPEYVWKQKVNRDMNNRQQDYNFHDSGGIRFMPTRGGIRTKLLISCILFGAVWGMFQINHPWANKGKAFITSALSEPFDFQPVAMWYERQLGGTPTLLPALNPVKQEEAQKVTADSKHYFVPVKGKVIAPFESSRLGVTLETKAEAIVAAIDTGLVVYAGSKEDTGFTVIIRHTNGMQSVYGWVEHGRVGLNDWIKGGETIGTVSKNSSKPSGYLYFAVSKDNKFINPADVVNFD
ncbi:peptidoglycan DD-metalloendopeptidase family protein [Paenibacillus sp. LMG 31456]|uniref:Peptidoglycan DD-metalloendopeptidase family protein n=1 Tax=Paenibacillus foliorum TaxID=2654974 RepID=A0A972GZZ5_9BACL|nr:peptidoglycan DD-metalloendopeptidase family protein [Paenibacillus foliorum]NOU96030.1 peptidoglycan DD-metalloendopeptidase family protein [Paenibacillus foliorum]